jgi:hypothetical protein
MKYSLIILLLLSNQLVSRKMKGGENNDIRWIRRIATFELYKYEFLAILNLPLQIQFSIVYLKLDKVKGLVNLYLLLNRDRAGFLNTAWENLQNWMMPIL